MSMHASSQKYYGYSNTLKDIKMTHQKGVIQRARKYVDVLYMCIKRID